MAGMTIELSEYVIDAIAEAVVKKMQEPKTECDNCDYKEWLKGEIEPETEWIPVSEGLPEKNMACLVTVGELNLVQIAMYSDLMKTINHRVFYQGNFGEDDFRAITQYVKAWKPLPEPYKEG